jgi:hypothetical protein
VNCDVQTVDSTSRTSIDSAGRFAVLIYFPGGPYKLIATKKSTEKDALEIHIKVVLKGNKTVDWYRVNDVGDIDKIIKYAGGTKVNGTTFTLNRTTQK